jgi:hypothetical protein
MKSLGLLIEAGVLRDEGQGLILTHGFKRVYLKEVIVNTLWDNPGWVVTLLAIVEWFEVMQRIEVLPKLPVEDVVRAGWMLDEFLGIVEPVYMFEAGSEPN